MQPSHVGVGVGVGGRALAPALVGSTFQFDAALGNHTQEANLLGRKRFRLADEVAGLRLLLE
jgi:hypothetical protein